MLDHELLERYRDTQSDAAFAGLVSVQIGASLAATQKRSTRALDRLRRMLGGRGLMFSTAGLVGVLAARPTQALPPHLLSVFYGSCHVSLSSTASSALIAKGAT